MALEGPPPLVDAKPLSVLLEDLRDERAAAVPFPPGETRVSLSRTRRFAAEPLPMLLDAYERHLRLERGLSEHTVRAYLGDVVSLVDFLHGSSAAERHSAHPTPG